MKKLLTIYFAFTYLFISAGVAKSQTKTEIDELYKDANSYFFFEDYEEALALYLKIYKFQPENNNLNFRIGFCYLNIPGSKHKAIPFLEKTIKNTTRTYNEESITEQRAPVDAFFYLGNAYLANNRIDDALKTYDKFYELTKGKGNWDFEYFNHQVKVAKNSLTIQRNPVNFIISNLGDKINDRFPNFNAVVSGNGQVLAYTTKQKFYNAINIVRKERNDQWGKPVNITLDLAVDGICSTLCLSYDGTELYLFKDDNHDGNIYVSRFNGKNWTPIKKLNKNINTEAYETHACLSPDGKQLYFSSNCKGGFGDLDIWVSTRSSGDEWGPAVNLGPNINTNLNETTPFLTSDGTTLYFSSEGHNNMGGYDIFVSQLSGKGEWSTPVNLGYPINTTDDDLFFHPIGDGSRAYLARFDDDSFGEQDIYEVELFIPRFRKSIVPQSKAFERLSDRTFSWIVVDTLAGKGIAELDPWTSTLNFERYPNRNYRLYLEGKKFELVEKRIEIAAKPSYTETTEQEPLATTKVEEKTTLTEVGKKDTNSHEHFDKLKQPLWPADSQNLEKNLKSVESTNFSDEQYLSEILLMLTPQNKQRQIIPILKKNWNFSSQSLYENIIRFAGSFSENEGKDAMIIALGKLIDEMVDLAGSESKVPGSKKLSPTNQPLFVRVYNELVNKSSKDLGDDLAQVMLTNPGIKSLHELIALYQKQNEKNYEVHRDEFLILLSQFAITRFMALPDEQKISLYNNLTDNNLNKAAPQSLVWLWYLLGIILIAGVLGLYQYKKKRIS